MDTPIDTDAAFRGRPQRDTVPGWSMFVAPLGTGAATVGVLGLLAGAPTTLSAVIVVLGLLAAAVGLWAAHR